LQSVANANGQPKRHANCHSDSYRHGDSYSYINGNGNGNSNGYGDGDREADTHAQGPPDTETSSDAASSPLGGSRKSIVQRSRDRFDPGCVFLVNPYFPVHGVWSGTQIEDSLRDDFVPRVDMPGMPRLRKCRWPRTFPLRQAPQKPWVFGADAMTDFYKIFGNFRRIRQGQNEFANKSKNNVDTLSRIQVKTASSS